MTDINGGWQELGGDLDEPRGLMRSILRGLACKCPNCGEGKVFDRFLKTKPRCDVCNEDLSHHRADDLPAYLNILVVGHVVVGFMMTVMSWELMGMYATMFVTIALCLIVSFALMQPLKGMVVGIQWAIRMHGFGGHED